MIIRSSPPQFAQPSNADTDLMMCNLGRVLRFPLCERGFQEACVS